MAASSDRENERDRAILPAAGREGESLEEGPTTISSDPLGFGASGEPQSPPLLEPPVVIAGEEHLVTQGVASTDTHPRPESLMAASPEGAARAEEAEELDEGLPDQRTVISTRPPILESRFDPPYTPHELGQALVGKRLAHFELEEFLGGGMGAVFRGRDLTLGRSVAVKVLPRGQDEDTIRRFQNEAQSAARLNHENIARVYFVGEEDGWNFIIFEHIEGATIRQLVVENGPMSLHDAVRHTLQAAEALDHACRRDVVHRDIKPSNLIVSREGITKLVDMGLARLHQVEASRHDLTASGVTLGTFDYISPEQARDPRSADVRSDLYSLGCTLYFMLTGRPPFPEGTVLQKLLDHQSRQPTDVRVFRPDLPDAAVEVVNKLLAKLPEHRYQTPGELIDDLHWLAERLELGVEAVGRKPALAAVERPSLWQDHLPWIAPTLLLIVAVAALEWRGRLADAPGDLAFPPIVVPSERAAAPMVVEPQNSGPAEMAAIEAETQSPAGDSVSDRAASTSSPSQENGPAAGERGLANGAAESGAAPRKTGARGAAASARAPEGRTAARAVAAERTSSDNPSASQRSPSDSATPRKLAAQPLLAEQVRTVVVGAKNSLPENAVWLETADEALRQASANKWPNLATIELRFTGVQEVRPVRLARPDLTIRAGQDHTPVLTFANGGGYGLDSHMIHVQGGEMASGRLTLEGVQLRWRVPDRTPKDWALLLLDDVSSIALRKCVLTIENVANGLPQANGAAFFRLASSTLDQRAMQQGAPVFEPPEIYLADCLVRGEADLIAADQVEAFQLVWNHGLLATTERLADLGGASLERTGAIQIELNHVTAVTENGLCRLAKSDTNPHQLPLGIVADNCLFATDSDAPLIEHETLNELSVLKAKADWGRLLQWMGANNARLQGEVVWRVEDRMDSIDFEAEDSVWNTLAAAPPFADYDLQWLNPTPFGWAPQVHQRTAESYAVEVRRAPEDFPAETPGASIAALPIIFREGMAN